MNRNLLLLVNLGVILCILTPCKGEVINGVLSKERVVRLPQDQEKWYISVVGDAEDTRYKEMLDWFSNVESLKTLKDQVHFCPVTTDSPVYSERYAKNVQRLPTVRVQNDKGVVIYEAAGRKIPMTGEGLYAAIAIAVGGSEELLPWRRNHVHPRPDPKPIRPIIDPKPQPLDDRGAPDLAAARCVLVLVLLCAAGLTVGVGIGQWEKLKDKWAGKK